MSLRGPAPEGASPTASPDTKNRGARSTLIPVHEIDLILTLTAGLTAALLAGYLTHRAGLSPIVGYLLAGVALGPYTPGFSANTELASQLAEVGVILLMFGVGLQFHVEELLSVKRVVIPGALAASGATFALGSFAAHAFGWPWSAAVVFGLALAVASTVVLVRVLADRGVLHTSAGHIAVGWLVVEDLLTVIALVILPGLFSGVPTVGGIAFNIVLTLAKVGGLIGVAAVIGTRVIPRLLDRVAATRSRELFTLTVLVVALGLAVGSARVFGVSMALGAFLAGMVVGRSDYSVRAATDALPMRDAFAVLFFVSVGMLLDPVALLGAPGLSLAALAIVVACKPAVASLMMWLTGSRRSTALTVGLSLGQIGEFSFILTALARDLRAVPAEAMNVVVGVSIASIVLNPLTARLASPADRWLSRRARQAAEDSERPGTPETGASSSLDPYDRAIVVGYGPTGRTVTRLLQENGIAPTVIELNMDTVRELRSSGLSAVYGDARHAETLVIAGVRYAGTLIVSGADPEAPELIRAARELNSRLRVMARAAYLRDVPPLRAAGSEEVFSGEGEVALAMTEAVLRRMGATPDQIDRERARVHEELAGPAAGTASSL